MKTCAVEGCDRKVLAKGLCGKHYQRMRATGSTESTKAEPGEPQRFIINAVASAGDECIIWPFYKDSLGYGVLKWEGKVRKAHRVALALAGDGAMPADLHAAHDPVVCNNPSCVNPNHLSWKTPSENSADQLVAGTTTAGERSWSAKLTDEDVRRIRNDDRLHEEIAKDYPVCANTIYGIKAGLRWKHI